MFDCENRVREVRGYDAEFPQVVAADEHSFLELAADGYLQGSLYVVGTHTDVGHAFHVHAASGCMI